MKERPILFSGPMVAAILAGRKSQTRRVVKPQPVPSSSAREWFATARGGPFSVYQYWWDVSEPVNDRFISECCPYGRPGDRLWVRETWCREFEGGYLYRADDIYGAAPDFVDGKGNQTARSGWKPSIHMPRAASRITLEITGVRVERLNDISEDDARAEGCAPAWLDEGGDRVNHGAAPTYRQGFARLWHSINGPGSWDANPWVWCICFRRVAP